jgi:hypothetical protein
MTGRRCGEARKYPSCEQAALKGLFSVLVGWSQSSYASVWETNVQGRLGVRTSGYMSHHGAAPREILSLTRRSHPARDIVGDQELFDRCRGVVSV